MKIIKRTLIFYAMFTMFSGNIFADDVNLECRYKFDSEWKNSYEYVASVFLDTTNMTAFIKHSQIPKYPKQLEPFNKVNNTIISSIDNKSNTLYTDGKSYWFTIILREFFDYQYQISRLNLTVSGMLSGNIPIIGECSVVKNQTLI